MEGVGERGARTKFKKNEPKSLKKEFAQKFEIPKWVYRPPLAHFEAPVFCDIWPRYRPKIGKMLLLAPLGLVTLVCGDLWFFEFS